jgi:CTP:molybdopterin cytidylyltransferase MocA/HD superfamily phosphodiesterase
MGRFKPLLSIGHSTPLETVVGIFLSAGIPDVSVVLGHRADELRPVVEACGARYVINSQFDQGMFSSVRAGVAALAEDTDACFMTPVDIPLVRVNTVRRLARCFTETRKPIIYPVFQKRRGHPTLISRTILAEALEARLDSTLAAVLAVHEEQSHRCFVPDQGIHLDMDTPEQLARIREFAAHREIPSFAECEAVLAEYQADERVVRHSRVVAGVAFALATALVERGVHVEPLLVRAAALLHDVAKGKPEHAQAGAQLLRDLDFGNAAEIVAAHTDYTLVAGKLDEAAVVYLADKLVSGDRVVGIEKRFQRSFDRFQGIPAALDSVTRRRATAEKIAHEIEKHLGAGLRQAILDRQLCGD